MIVFDSYLENTVKNMTGRRKVKENCNINWFNEEIIKVKIENPKNNFNNKINNATD